MVHTKEEISSNNVKELNVNIDNLIPLLEKSNYGNSMDEISCVEQGNLWMLLNEIFKSSFNESVAKSDATIENIFKFLKNFVSSDCFNVEKDFQFIDLITYLNGSSFIHADNVIRNKISSINEYWMTKKQSEKIIPGMEYFTLNYLLEICSSSKPLISDIQRLNALRKVMTITPFERAVPSLKPLLINLVKNQIFINTHCGQRFIAHALILSERLVHDIHKNISLELHSCMKKKALSYAKMYILAWQNASPNIKKVIARTCFQHLMETFLNEQRTSLALTKHGQNLLNILNLWHSERKKKSPEYITMITDCYQPIIWKYMESNYNVHRCNAVDLLLKAFPLQRPDDDVTASESLFNQQFDAMMSSLRDDCHIVRIIAIREICNILSHYWNSFTPTQIHKLMNIISKEDAHDASSAEVRRMVYVGFQSFLNNSLAFDYLKKILPGMVDNIHDVHQKVRIAFIQLLISIKEKDDPNFKFYDFVPMFSLYYRLGEENIKCGKLIVKLLMSSYYQEDMSIMEWTKRFIFLIKTYPMSYRNFFFYSEKILPFSNAFSIICDILTQIGMYVISKLNCENAVENDDSFSAKSKKVKCSSVKKPMPSTSSNLQDDSNILLESDKRKDCAFDDPHVVGGLFDIITILWVLHDNKLNLPENEDKRVKLYEIYIKYAQPFINYYKVSNNVIDFLECQFKYIIIRGSVIEVLREICSSGSHHTDLFSSILCLSGNIPASLLRSNSITLPGYCMKLLKSIRIDSNGADNENILTVLIAMIKWGKGSDILEQITLWLDAAFETQNMNVSMLPKKRVKIHEAIKPNSVVAIYILDILMKTEYVKLSILKKNYEQLFDLWKSMSRIKELLQIRLEQGEPFEDDLVSDEFLKLCFRRFVKIIPLLKENKNRNKEEAQSNDNEGKTINYQQEMNSLIQWAEETLFPLLQEKQQIIEFEEISLITSVYNDLLYVADNMILLHIVTHHFYWKVSHLVLRLLQTKCSAHFVKSASRVVTAINFSGKLLFNVSDNLNIFSKVVPCIVSHILNVLTCQSHTSEDMDIIKAEAGVIKKNLIKILETYQDNFKLKINSREVVRQLQMLTGIFLDTVVMLFSKEISPEVELPTYSELTELPFTISFIISLFFNKKFWGSLFIHVINLSISADMYDCKSLIGNIVILHLFALNDKKVNVIELRKACSLLSNSLTKLKAECIRGKNNITENKNTLESDSISSVDSCASTKSNSNDNDKLSEIRDEKFQTEILIEKGLNRLAEIQVLLTKRTQENN